MIDTIGIWNKSDIDAISIPSNLPQNYPLEIGTVYQSMTVSNYSPYYITFTGLDNKTFATVKPWTITPVSLNSVGRVFVNINSSLGSVSSNNNNLLDNEQLSVTLSTKPNYNPTVELDPQTGISYQFQDYDMGEFTFTSQTLAAGTQTSSQYSDWLDITGAKLIMVFIDWLNLSGMSGNCYAMVWYHVTSNELYPQDYNMGGGDYNDWGVNGNSYNAYGSDYDGQPDLTAGWDKLRLEHLIRNSDSVSHTVSGSIHVTLKVGY